MLTLSRPAILESDEQRLDAEYRAARWMHHRLLDFEAEHQRVLDETADAAAPGIVRTGRILARLARRAKRAERTTAGQWCPSPRTELAAKLRAKLAALRDIRNADPRWKVALRWADEQVGDPKQIRRRRAKPADEVKRRKTETDEAFAKRFALLTSDESEEHYAAKLATARRDSRRDTARKALYQQRRIYWGTWNALVRSVDQARADVLKRRKQGLSSDLRRPKFRDPCSLAADAGGFRVVERGATWWTIDIRIGTEEGKHAEWVRVRAKCGNWHAIPENTELATAKLTRRPDGNRWAYSLSITVAITKDASANAPRGVVSFDWGHREHGHDRASEGIRAFTWLGDDGESGEILIPPECRRALDEIDVLKTRVDETFNARKRSLELPDRNRHAYRRRLMLSGVRTAEESDWLRWEMRYERMISARRKRVQNLRRETYLRAVRGLRRRYAVFAFEGESVTNIRREQKEQQAKHRQRSNRDLATRYEFVELCERFGAKVIAVPARNTTRECPECGQLDENGPELLIACTACGVVRDKDHGAARVILRRAQEALANQAA